MAQRSKKESMPLKQVSTNPANFRPSGDSGPVMIKPMQRNAVKNVKWSLLLTLAAWFVAATPARADGTAIVLDLEGALGVATAEYVIGGIEQADQQNANVIIIRMDTPGGLVSPMRDIVQAILASDIPVVTYVAPGGARADSAGTYILLASHVAAMAPTTHLGAATPVSLTGDGFSPGKDNESAPTTDRTADDDTEQSSDEASEEESSDDDSGR